MFSDGGCREEHTKYTGTTHPAHQRCHAIHRYGVSQFPSSPSLPALPLSLTPCPPPLPHSLPWLSPSLLIHTAESSTALPAILDVASTSNTSFRVSYSMDPRITDLISNFSFFYRQLNRSIDTEMVLSLPPMPQGVLNIQNLPAGELVLVRFLTSIDGGRPYRSTTHNISLSEEEVIQFMEQH